MIITEAVDFFQEKVQCLGISVGQEYTLEDVIEELRDARILIHLLDALGLEKKALVPTDPLIEQTAPPVLLEFACEEGRLSAEFF